MISLGIDIGLSGALAVVRQDQLLAVADMPTREKPGESLIRREIDARALYELIVKMVGEEEKLAVFLENVYGMRKGQEGKPQGSASVFSFGDTRGAIRSVLEVLKLTPHWIAPIVWKRQFGLHRKKGEAEIDKNAARLKALELYPSADLQRVKDHNRAEAILIARFGYERMTWAAAA